MNNRTLQYLTVCRSAAMGVCIIWIMLFHSTIPAPDNKILLSLWYVFVSFGGGCGVNIFLLLSGFGLMYSAKKRGSEIEWKSWGRKRLVRILPAYIIVSTLYYVVKGYGLADLLYNVSFVSFLIEGVRDFWYIFAILFCYATFPIISKLYNTYNAHHVTLLSLIVLFVLNCCISVFMPEVYAHIEIFTQRIYCFAIGCYFAFLFYEGKVHLYNAITIVSLVLFIILYVVHPKFIGSDRIFFICLSIPFLQLMNVMINFLSAKLNNLLSYFGNRSLELYLVHVSFGVLAANSLSNFSLSLIVYFMLSILLAELTYRLVNKIKS